MYVEHRLPHALYVQADVFDGISPDGHDALFVALADDFYKTNVQIKMRKAQLRQFRNAQPAGVKGFEHGAIAHAVGFAQINDLQHALNFFKTEHFGNVPGQSRAV